MENRATVNKLIPFSNVDGPGNRLAIFFQGCNINCIYCHNHETIHKCISCMECVPGCPAKAIRAVDGKVVYDEKLCIGCDQCIRTCRYDSSPKTREYSVDELFNIIEEYKLFIRGITVSGGEPTLQHAFIAELFHRVKPLGLTCFVDTNSFFIKDQITDLIEAADKFMVDIKAIGDVEKLCSTNLKNNIENLQFLLNIDKVYEVRTVLVSDYFNVEQTVSEVANIIKNYPEVIYKLIRVHTLGLSPHQKDLLKDKIPSEEYVRDIAKKVEEIGVKKVELII